MNYLILIPIIAFIVYVACIYKLYGVLPSLSESCNRLGEKHDYLFMIFIWCIGIPPAFLEPNILFIMSAICMAFVSIASDFHKFRITGSTAAIILAFLGLWCAYDAWHWLPIFVTICVLLKWAWPNVEIYYNYGPGGHSMGYDQIKWNFGPVPNYYWWIQIIAFVMIMAGLIIQ